MGDPGRPGGVEGANAARTVERGRHGGPSVKGNGDTATRSVIRFFSLSHDLNSGLKRTLGLTLLCVSGRGTRPRDTAPLVNLIPHDHSRLILYDHDDLIFSPIVEFNLYPQFGEVFAAHANPDRS